MSIRRYSGQVNQLFAVIKAAIVNAMRCQVTNMSEASEKRIPIVQTFETCLPKTDIYWEKTVNDLPFVDLYRQHDLLGTDMTKSG